MDKSGVRVSGRNSSEIEEGGIKVCKQSSSRHVAKQNRSSSSKNKNQT